MNINDTLTDLEYQRLVQNTAEMLSEIVSTGQLISNDADYIATTFFYAFVPANPPRHHIRWQDFEEVAMSPQRHQTKSNLANAIIHELNASDDIIGLQHEQSPIDYMDVVTSESTLKIQQDVAKELFAEMGHRYAIKYTPQIPEISSVVSHDTHR